MSGGLPAITGPDLIRLLKKDGWKEDGRGPHGIVMKKEFSNGLIRITCIPTRNESLPIGTLKAILGSKQTNLGNDGLKRLLKL
jgi:predicted RNA binding protein YcfA (HicA-like mRNA interferase family)